jgi:hypothetical protein
VCAAEQTAGRDVVHSVFKSRGALPGVPDMLDRIGSLSRSARHRTIFESDYARDCKSQKPGNRIARKVNQMLYTIAVVLLIMWVLGLVTAYTLDGFIHILLVIALVMVLVNFIGGRRTL